MAEQLKYRLAELSELLPRNVDIVKQLEGKGIPRSTYYRHRTIRKNSTQSISGDHLLIYAQYFNVGIDQLLAPAKVKRVKVKTVLR